ncbi:glycosyl hydrolase family 18 protein, partial (plasmid) [Chromobacterium amazonense]|uniref:glycosyl hydrolase family 18 protein n=1 Tax=Chromobacterium amazonense TaxID=1382803 RepID=UPI00237E2A55
MDGKGDNWNDPLRGNFNQLRKLKLVNPQLKVLISLGGWTWSKNFGKFAATDAGRKAMVSSCIDLYIKGNLPVGENAGGQAVALGVFDGFDIDWEYPGGGGLPTNTVDPNDRQNYTLLLAEFRNQLNALSTANKRRYYLTAAIGSGVDKIRNTEPAAYSSYLDWINVMTYDFHGGWDAKGPTNFQSNLYRDPAAPVTGDQVYYTVDDAVKTLVNAGVPRAKINVGLPFYGRGWAGVAAGPKGDGLYQVATGPAKGTYEQGIEDYRILVKRSAKQFNSPVVKQLWTYDGNEFWSYDDPATIRGKLDYVRSQQLGGVFSWSLDGDDAQATLLKSVDGKGDNWNDPLRGNFNQLRKLKLANPQLKVLISLGGWTWSKNFGKFAATDAGRKTMVSSCIDLYIKGNLPVGENAGGQAVALGVFDGFDIDWEYPGGGGLPTNTVDPNDRQ